MDWSQFEAALFDLDGVLTPTADLHMRAWRQMFSTYFVEHDVAPAYTNADYFTYVDGKPRYDGVRATLASRGIELPEGDPADEPGAETVRGLGNAKNALFNRMLRDEGVVTFPGTFALLDELADRGVKVAVVSSSSTRARCSPPPTCPTASRSLSMVRSPGMRACTASPHRRRSSTLPRLSVSPRQGPS